MSNSNSLGQTNKGPRIMIPLARWQYNYALTYLDSASPVL